MKEIGKILGLALLAEVLTLFIDLTLSFSGSAPVRVVCSICTVGILGGLMVQGGYSTGKADRKSGKTSPLRSALLGIVGSAPYLVCWIVLLLARQSASGGFYRLYKLLCAPFLQVCNLLSADTDAGSLPGAGLLVLLLLSLVPLFCIFISHRMTVQGRSLEEAAYERRR
ncbi:MAG: hypothetical protein IJ055_09575 [Oscillospiraceae bacterium]|nr:hypothetical protein [Oscillospiraceae bacterium]